MLHINLILDFPGLGVFLGRNGSAPGNEIWRLPHDQAANLDAVDAAVTRITRNLLGLDLHTTSRFVAAYMDTSHNPQPDQHLSICYALPCTAKVFKTTPYQFTTTTSFIATTADIPTPIGNICRYFLEEYWGSEDARNRVCGALRRLLAGT